jgi:hypothetical protein
VCPALPGAGGSALPAPQAPGVPHVTRRPRLSPARCDVEPAIAGTLPHRAGPDPGPGDRRARRTASMKFSQFGEWLRDQRGRHGWDQRGMARQIIKAARANGDLSAPGTREPQALHLSLGSGLARALRAIQAALLPSVRPHVRSVWCHQPNVQSDRPFKSVQEDGAVGFAGHGGDTPVPIGPMKCMSTRSSDRLTLVSVCGGPGGANSSGEPCAKRPCAREH